MILNGLNFFLEISFTSFIFLKIQSLREKRPNTEFFSGLYFPVFGLNKTKYGPEETPYLDTFHAVTQI